MRHVYRVFICLTLAFVLAISACPPVRADKIDDAKKKGKELEERKKQTEAITAELNEKLTSLIGQMAETEKKLTAKRNEISEAEEQLALAKVKENDQYDHMKMRIRYMYEEGGDTAVMNLLIESQSITDLLNRVEYASEMSDYDREMLEEYKETVRQIQKQEKKLRQQYKKLEELQDQLTAQRDEVQQLLAEKQLEIADLEKQIGDNAKELKRLIAEAEAAKKAREEAAKAAAEAAAAQQAGSSSGSSGASSSSGHAGKPRITGHGQFTHPCPGTYLSSGFGYRSFDHSFHKGYDFASHGKSMPTYAAADGTVVIAGFSSSAGNWVVINHGNGLVTKYMHHSKLYVHAGQKVTKGQNIGMSGTTGYSTGIHLHFQVEVDGAAVNPGSYL